jgi:hypothetical protein
VRRAVMMVHTTVEKRVVEWVGQMVDWSAGMKVEWTAATLVGGKVAQMAVWRVVKLVVMWVAPMELQTAGP